MLLNQHLKTPFFSGESRNKWWIDTISIHGGFFVFFRDLFPIAKEILNVGFQSLVYPCHSVSFILWKMILTWYPETEFHSFDLFMKHKLKTSKNLINYEVSLFFFFLLRVFLKTRNLRWRYPQIMKCWICSARKLPQLLQPANEKRMSC